MLKYIYILLVSGISLSLGTLYLKHKKDCYFYSLVIFVYSVVVAFGVIYHEPWRDEAQAWLIARDLDLLGILKQMGYEGSPALWHFLLHLLAKSGFPYQTQAIIHATLAIICVSIFVIWAPFNKSIKTLFVFSYYISYEYAIIARNYNLSILFLFIIATIYPSRFNRPVAYSLPIFLLFNTNVHSYFAAVALLLLFAYEIIREKHSFEFYFALFIMITGGLIAVLQLIPPSDGLITGHVRYIALVQPFNAIVQALMPGATYNIITYIIAFSALVIISLQLYAKPQAIFILSLSYLWLFYIITFKYPGLMRHQGFALIFMIFAIWLSKHHKNTESSIGDYRVTYMSAKGLLVHNIPNYVLALCLALSCVYSLKMYVREYCYNFSSAKQMSQYMIRNGFNKFEIVALDRFQATALLPYLPYTKFWFTESENYETYITWKSHSPVTDTSNSAKLIERARIHFTDIPKVLLISSKPIDASQVLGLRLIFSTTGTSVKTIEHPCDEWYWLYAPVTPRIISPNS